MPFQSQAQQRFAFGTSQPWAKRWADETDFAKLPKRVRRIRSKAGLKGCTCKAAALKGEQIAPGVTRIRGNLCNVHGKYGPCDKGLSGKRPKGGKGGGRGRKPAKVKPTPEQRAQEREAQHAQNRADVLSKMNIAPDGQQALSALRNGEQPDPGAIARGGFEKAGLVEQARDGSYRLTASGRATLGAADQGDLGRAGSTISSARDRVGARDDKRAEAERKRQERLAKKRGGKKPAVAQPTGTGAAKPPSASEQRAATLFQQRQQDRQERIARRTQADTERAQRRQDADKRRAAMDARRAAADERRKRAEARAGARAESAANRTPRRSKEMQTLKAGSPGDYLVVEDRTKPSTWHLQVKRNGTPDHGLMGGAWASLHGGYRGNKYSGPNAGQALAKLRALYAAEKMPLPSEKDYTPSFTVYKDASGADRWVSVSSTAYRDRDREIVSTKALQGAVALADASGYRGPLRFWHVPGVEIGDCDFQATAQDGRFLIESGTFRSPALAAAVKSHADGYQVSIGFTHPASEPDPNGVFSHIAIFERSLVPKGRASNPFTQVTLATKEIRMLTTEKAAALKELLGGDQTLLDGLLSQVATTDKAAQDGGVAYKDAETPAWAQALIGRIEAIETSLKAAPVMVEGSPEEEAAEPPDEAMAEGDTSDGTGDENMLTGAEISAIAQQTAQVLLDALMPHLGIGQKMDEVKSLLGGMAGSYAKKDAEQAEIKEAVAALKEQVADLSGSQPRILAGGYRASQAASTVTADETKIKEAGPQADPKVASFAAFLQDMGLGGQQPQA
jgi:hypothetical protein